MNWNKTIPLVTILFLFYLTLLSALLRINLNWLLFENFSYQEFINLYAHFPFVAFMIIKIIPQLGFLLIVIANILLLKENGVAFISKYNELLGNNILVIAFLLILTSFIIYTNINETNYSHNLIILITTWVMAAYILFVKKLPTSNFQIIFLVSLAFILRYFYYIYASPFDLMEDSLARVSQVYLWQHYGGIPGGLAWPGGHHLLIYLVSIVSHVPYEVGGRILSFISSILIIPFGYKLISELFNKRTAFFSILLYVIHPFFIKFSTIQMTGIPFLFLMVMGVYYAYKFFKRGSNGHLILSIVPLNIVSLLRFEAWIIIPLFSLVFLLKYCNAKKAMYWCLLSIISAILFSILSFCISGNPIYGVTASDIEVIETLKGVDPIDSIKSLLYWPWFPLRLIPFLILGIIYNIKKGKNKYLIIGVSLLSFYYFFKMGQLTLMPFWRYLTFIIFFVTPFVFYYLERNLTIVSLYVVFSIVGFSYSSRESKNAYGSYKAPPHGLLESAFFVKDNYLQKEDPKFILSMDPYVSDDIWRVFANVYHDYAVFHRLHPGSEKNISDEKFTKPNVIKNLINEEYNLILVQKGFEIDSVFEDDQVANFLEEKQIDTISWEEFTLYYVN